MAAPVFGRVDKPEQLNLEPFKFTLVGYRRQENGDSEEVKYEFTCTGVQPFGSQIDIIRSSGIGVGGQGAAVISYIEKSLISDDERVKFREALDEPDVFFDGAVLGQVAEWLMETYTDRPTLPRAASRSGRSRTGKR